MTNKRKTVLITGATSGIGAACAERFAKENFDLVLTGRRQERLSELQKRLQQQFQVRVHILCFDVQNREAVFAAFTHLQEQISSINILINNAGLALGKEHFDEANMDDWEVMLNTNVHGLLYVSRAAIPLLKKADTAHIFNIGSIAGKEVYENGNVYCASKSAVDALSQAMRIDLLQYGMRVTAIHPGAAETEFSLVRFKGDEQRAAATYENYEPLTGADIADCIYYAASLPQHVCINDLVITCTAQASAHYHKKQA